MFVPTDSILDYFFTNYFGELQDCMEGIEQMQSQIFDKIKQIGGNRCESRVRNPF
jgi:hypothetical protein